MNLPPLQLDFEFSSASGIDRHRIIIAYDTPDNRRRRRLARCARSYGDRVQQSVFEANLTDAQVRILSRTLASISVPGEDDIRLYPQCARCAALRQIIGAKVEPASLGATVGPQPAALPRLVVA